MLLPFFLSLFTFIINSSSSHHSFFFYFQLYKQFLSSYLIQCFLLFTLFTLPLFSSHHSVFFLLITLFALIPLFLSHHTGCFFSTFYLIHSSSYFSFSSLFTLPLLISPFSFFNFLRYSLFLLIFQCFFYFLHYTLI